MAPSGGYPKLLAPTSLQTNSLSYRHFLNFSSARDAVGWVIPSFTNALNELNKKHIFSL